MSENVIFDHGSMFKIAQTAAFPGFLLAPIYLALRDPPRIVLLRGLLTSRRECLSTPVCVFT